MKVDSAELGLPFLSHARTETIAGDPRLDLPSHTGRTVTLPAAAIEAGESEGPDNRPGGALGYGRLPAAPGD